MIDQSLLDLGRHAGRDGLEEYAMLGQVVAVAQDAQGQDGDAEQDQYGCHHRKQKLTSDAHASMISAGNAVARRQPL